MTEKKKGGRPPKLLEHRLFSLRLPAGMHRELRVFALMEGRSLNDILVGVIGDWWTKQARDSHGVATRAAQSQGRATSK
jgi:predicted HicB family RNase H-like nuclease